MVGHGRIRKARELIAARRKVRKLKAARKKVEQVKAAKTLGRQRRLIHSSDGHGLATRMVRKLPAERRRVRKLQTANPDWQSKPVHQHHKGGHGTPRRNGHGMNMKSLGKVMAKRRMRKVKKKKKPNLKKMKANLNRKKTTKRITWSVLRTRPEVVGLLFGTMCCKRNGC